MPPTPTPTPSALESSELDTQLARLHFSKAAHHYDAAAVIQREIADRLLERLEIITLKPQRLLDIGCGTGYSLPTLAQRYPQADIGALDFALPMLQVAQKRVYPERTLLQQVRQTLWPEHDPFIWINGDMLQLPILSGSIDLLHSSLALQWGQHRLVELLKEWHRVLNTNGVLFFATLGPDTLKELKQAFSTVEQAPHVHTFVDMHDIGDALLQVGFSDPVMEMETLTIRYSNPIDLFKDLKGIGAVNTNKNRSRGLMGKTRWKQLYSAWENAKKEDGWPITYEVIYGHAWKVAPPVPSEYAPIQWMNPRNP
jgi:malonyl-CoA O-methyltransferase